MRRGVVVAVAWLGLAGAVFGAPPAPETEPALRTRLGREALKAGKAPVARRHFLDAVAIDPAHVPAWAELASLDGGDPDARTLWALDAAAATTDASGRRPSASFGPALGPTELGPAFDLAGKRFGLARAILDLSGRLQAGTPTIVARWLRTLAVETAAGVPAAAPALRTGVDKALERTQVDPDRVRTALAAIVSDARTGGDLARGIEAARLALGLAEQHREASHEKSQAEARGPKFALDELRGKLRDRLMAPLDAKALEALLVPSAASARREFEDAHATWANPIVATSKKGRYRIESTCGVESTLEAVDLVEHAHERLVVWCGKDPFEGRPGLVRLCRRASDLAAEGAPFWWASGFQSADVTTVMVEWQSDDSFAGLLSHELTHRFDGALHPGLPGWVLEGRANYVAATSRPRGPMDEQRLDAGQIDEAAWILGGGPQALGDFVSGKDPEYRHNYPAGYALWTFLSQWTGDGKPPRCLAPGADPPTPYRPRIAALVDAMRSLAPLAAMQQVLCDGKDGRADSWATFSKQLAAFVGGLAAIEPPPWAAAWLDHPGGAFASDYAIRDRSNTPKSRRRLEPPAEGESLAALCARLFEEIGKIPEALDAHALADAVDEIDVERWRRALALETSVGRTDSAFARRRLLARMDPTVVETTHPEIPYLLGVSAAANAYLDAAAKASADALAGGRPRTARALRAEHDALAVLVGRAALGEAGLPPTKPLEPSEREGEPDCAPAVDPFPAGLVSDRWSAQSNGASDAPFVLPAPDEVELGRRGHTTVTGDDLDAAWIGAACRTLETYAGTYTLRLRVRPSGPYVDGRVIVGWTRRDRGVELVFHAGDRRVAEKTGRGESSGGGVDVVLSDLRTYDHRITSLSRHVPVRDPRPGFDAAIHVCGPYVRVEIDGHDAMSFRRITGEPVEGSIGFAADRGRTVFAEVRVVRHRVLGGDAACRCDRFDAPLDLDRPATVSWTSLPGRRVVGLEPSPHVRLLLWSTGLSDVDPTGEETIHEAVTKVRETFSPRSLPCEITVAVKGERSDDGVLEPPASFPFAAGLGLPSGRVRLHRGFDRLAAESALLPQTYALGWSSWGGIFVDPSGIARSRGPQDDVEWGTSLAHLVEGR